MAGGGTPRSRPKRKGGKPAGRALRQRAPYSGVTQARPSSAPGAREPLRTHRAATECREKARRASKPVAPFRDCGVEVNTRTKVYPTPRPVQQTQNPPTCHRKPQFFGNKESAESFF